jgi:hypothetical protein
VREVLSNLADASVVVLTAAAAWRYARGWRLRWHPPADRERVPPSMP